MQDPFISQEIRRYLKQAGDLLAAGNRRAAKAAETVAAALESKHGSLLAPASKRLVLDSTAELVEPPRPGPRVFFGSVDELDPEIPKPARVPPDMRPTMPAPLRPRWEESDEGERRISVTPPAPTWHADEPSPGFQPDAPAPDGEWAQLAQDPEGLAHVAARDAEARARAEQYQQPHCTFCPGICVCDVDAAWLEAELGVAS